MKLILMLMLMMNTACQQGDQKVQTLGAEAFSAKMKEQKGILLDVRTPGEFGEGRIPGSINIDFEDAGFAAGIDTLNKEQTYYVYCRSGRRSGMASEEMAKKGFKNVYNLQGGIIDWNKQGLDWETK